MFVQVEHYIIGAWRAVWVPGQDLATPHLMRKAYFVTKLYMQYVHLCVRKHAYAL